MLRPIVKYGTSVLQKPAAVVTEFDAELQRLIDDMVETMYAAPGIGLAAPQIGVPLRVCVIDLSVGKRGGELLTLVNPEFVEREGMQLEEEGCLSVPGFTATVARPLTAVVRALDRDGARADHRRHRTARARAAARDRSSRRRALPRSAARHQARPHRPQDPQAAPNRQVVMALRVVFFGTPAFAVPTLERAADAQPHASSAS